MPFCKMEIWDFCRICLWSYLALKGLVNSLWTSGAWSFTYWKTGLPIQGFRCSRTFSAGTIQKVVFHSLSNRIFRKRLLTVNSQLNQVLWVRACIQGERVTLPSGLKISRFYKQNFTGRVSLSPESTLPALLIRIEKPGLHSLLGNRVLNPKRLNQSRESEMYQTVKAT